MFIYEVLKHMSDSIPIFEAKNKLPFFVHKAETEGPVHLSRRNKEVAVIISASEYEDMVLQLKNLKKGKTFIERVSVFRKRNEAFYEDDNFDFQIQEIFSSLRPSDANGFHQEENIWDGVMEDYDD